jgi:hypothetical protein
MTTETQLFIADQRPRTATYAPMRRHLMGARTGMTRCGTDDRYMSLVLREDLGRFPLCGRCRELHIRQLTRST